MRDADDEHAKSERAVHVAVDGGRLVVRASTIAGAGLGVFVGAGHAFARGDTLTRFDGALIDQRAAQRLRFAGADTYVRTLVHGHAYLDAAHVAALVREPQRRALDGVGVGGLANHAPRCAANAAYVRLWQRATASYVVVLRATRRLAAGDEVLAYYGRDYWW
ncbi:MAG: hypothetical protein H6835_20520 [Planctomycetes bacterium]|nr:hypothetical protein [Planctomycetota bacterium]